MQLTRKLYEELYDIASPEFDCMGKPCEDDDDCVHLHNPVLCNPHRFVLMDKLKQRASLDQTDIQLLIDILDIELQDDYPERCLNELKGLQKALRKLPTYSLPLVNAKKVSL